MAFFGEFNVEDAPVSDSLNEPVPAGIYDVQVHSAELRNTKSGTGQYVAVRYDIIGPTHAGRVVFGNFNTKNPNPKAEEIGRQQLGEFQRATGVARLTDTDQFAGLMCKIKVTIRKSEEYGDSNEVKGWKAMDNAMPKAITPQPTAQPVTANGSAPWAR